MKYTKYLLVLITAVFLLSACQSSTEAKTESKELSLNAATLKSLVVDHRNGSIEIRGDKNSETIQVSAETSHSGNIDPDKLQLQLEERDGEAHLKAFYKGQFLVSGKGSVNLKVVIPEALSVQVRSHQDGAIVISDLLSAVNLENVNGNIDVKNIGGDVHINNRDGDINIVNAAADLYIDNVNGTIIAEEIGGSAIIDVSDGKLDLDGVDGDVTIKRSKSANVNVSNVKGSVNQKQ
ncbi:DUF4097 and DUF4098 domain-containing protein YvlB [Fontibacillus solani]|uniref:DUF4097 and DUF4098 domain-containing protein YvlB n=1 Tax=Fontibacillus solani TaxID=1572857 RepID=A0A7W3SPZ5_9BACL|nr:hypothetical protein [Fontibacillus solani]MBA9083962.1 DUF4097 and DUF4098 domain-containing protein YvlB [Fontibacillus solani]